MISAYYDKRNGAGCVRSIHTIEEAEKLLQGGLSALEVTIKHNDTIIGERIHDPLFRDDQRTKWYWWLDTDYFN